MVGALGVDRTRIEPIDGPTRCRLVYLADPPVRLGAAVHPIARTVFATLGALRAQSAIERCDRLFVSRSGVPTRRLVNERDVEALFSRYGFAIVQPERHSIEDQIALFGGARMLAGLGGSAMHSAVFSPRDTPVLIVQTGLMSTATDTALAQRPRRLGFVLGESEPGASPTAGRWWVNTAIVEAAIKAHFHL